MIIEIALAIVLAVLILKFWPYLVGIASILLLIAVAVAVIILVIVLAVQHPGATAVIAIVVAVLVGGIIYWETHEPLYTVMLKAYPAEKKFAVMQVIREITGLSLKEAKGVVEGVPFTVKDALARADAEKIKKELEDVGATVEVSHRRRLASTA